jgi:hypothetical protein
MGGSSGGHGGNNQPQQNNFEENPQNQQQSSSFNDHQQPQIQQPFMQENSNLNTNTDKCFNFSNIFNECMKYNNNNTNICMQSFEDLKKCQNNI